jgi:site-specific DNA-cytosine methylase
MKPVMLDLFSGLGGASEAFIQNGWTVIRIENNPKLQHIPKTFDLDVLDWKNWITLLPDKIDLIWASPPCLEFSQAFNAPKSIAKREGRDFEPDLNALKAAIEIIEHYDPTFWCIENVVGAKEHFKPLLGKPRQIIESFMLWGNFPYLHMDKGFKHLKKDVGSNNPLRSNYRAIIPFEISFELYSTIKNQTTLLRWT